MFCPEMSKYPLQIVFYLHVSPRLLQIWPLFCSQNVWPPELIALSHNMSYIWILVLVNLWAMKINCCDSSTKVVIITKDMQSGKNIGLVEHLYALIQCVVVGTYMQILEMLIPFGSDQ